MTLTYQPGERKRDRDHQQALDIDQERTGRLGGIAAAALTPDAPEARKRGRASAIAAIRSLADFVHGDPIPAPDYITAHYSITAADEPDAGKREQTVRDIADHYGVEFKESALWWWTTVNVSDRLETDVTISYSLFADKDQVAG